MTAADLVCALEFAGVALSAAPDGRILVTPASLLSDDDRADLARLKCDILALLNAREAARVCDGLGTPPARAAAAQGLTHRRE